MTKKEKYLMSRDAKTGEQMWLVEARRDISEKMAVDPFYFRTLNKNARRARQDKNSTNKSKEDA